ncbi:MBL fold metallo-hydrolase [Pacificimonas flava]|uniref:MBL fold metallo-hydrolase n=2 Tax=Pacificimonas TaxID=1960290 RepID=A0A219B2T1_9SPHN|nr:MULTISPECIES: MBL fold metallo-hydrolase [Pacificimonas]MBZ6377896.1 MBL fold metallo-hydrolase [Pacificimonas aurantium]OWV32446.1 MBL fold metallo-hydrolase [Pacificimonas flava]
MTEPAIEAFFDEPTHTISYLVSDPETKDAAVIDPVLDFDLDSGEADVRSADAILEAAAHQGLNVRYILETHAHADHLSAAPYLKQRTGALIGIGEHIRDVQRIFRPMFGADDMKPEGGDFDRLFRDGETFEIGDLEVKVLHVPGHTPADIAYLIEDALFAGDTMFMPDYGTARADFPGGDARQLYRSIQRLLALPGGTRVFLCHDYKAPGRDEYRWETTIAEQRAANVHVGGGVGEEEFVAMRESRDETLPVPRLLLPSIQVNIRAGKFPPAEANGVSYLRIPVKAVGRLKTTD